MYRSVLRGIHYEKQKERSPSLWSEGESESDN